MANKKYFTNFNNEFYVQDKDAISVFNTLNDCLTSPRLEKGMVVCLLGKINSNDGGLSYWIVKESLEENDYIFYKTNNLYLVYISDIINLNAIDINQLNNYIKNNVIINLELNNNIDIEDNLFSINDNIERYLLFNGKGNTINYNITKNDSSLFKITNSFKSLTFKDVNILGSGNSNLSNISIFDLTVNDGDYLSRNKYENMTIKMQNIDSIIWNLKGNTQNDQTLIENVNCNYFKNVMKIRNRNSVNIVFNRCGFFGGGGATYFDIEDLDSNFIVTNSTFSFYSSETLISLISSLNGNIYSETPMYNFIFKNNRYEIVGSDEANENIILLYSNYGRVIFEGGNFQLGGQSYIYNQPIVKIYGLGGVIFKNINFYGIKALTGVADEYTQYGSGFPLGIEFINCQFVDCENIMLGCFDGNTEYDVMSIFTKKTAKIEFKNCRELRTKQLIDYVFNEFSFNNLNYYAKPQKIIVGNISGSRELCLPLTLTMLPCMIIRTIRFIPTTWTITPDIDKIRIYFDSNKQHSFDKNFTGNLRSFILFDGMAVYYSNNNTVIHIVGVKNEEEKENLEIDGVVEIEYIPLSKYLMGIFENSASETFKVIGG